MEEGKTPATPVGKQVLSFLVKCEYFLIIRQIIQAQIYQVMHHHTAKRMDIPVPPIHTGKVVPQEDTDPDTMTIPMTDTMFTVVRKGMGVMPAIVAMITNPAMEGLNHKTGTKVLGMETKGRRKHTHTAAILAAERMEGIDMVLSNPTALNQARTMEGTNMVVATTTTRNVDTPGTPDATTTRTIKTAGTMVDTAAMSNNRLDTANNPKVMVTHLEVMEKNHLNMIVSNLRDMTKSRMATVVNHLGTASRPVVMGIIKLLLDMLLRTVDRANTILPMAGTKTPSELSDSI